jgi:Cdc6-like AAA superfamily ATPase
VRWRSYVDLSEGPIRCTVSQEAPFNEAQIRLMEDLAQQVHSTARRFADAADAAGEHSEQETSDE